MRAERHREGVAASRREQRRSRATATARTAGPLWCRLLLSIDCGGKVSGWSESVIRLFLDNLRTRWDEWRIHRAEQRGDLTCDLVVRLQILRAERMER